MTDRLLYASESLVGISTGDAFGETFFGEESSVKADIQQRIVRKNSLDFTDDTIMAIAVFKSLEKFGNINQNFLAEEFTKNYYIDSNRGYGPSMHQYFRAVQCGEYWKEVSYAKFEGQGSMGNGGAMRLLVLIIMMILIHLKKMHIYLVKSPMPIKKQLKAQKLLQLLLPLQFRNEMGF